MIHVHLQMLGKCHHPIQVMASCFYYLKNQVQLAYVDVDAKNQNVPRNTVNVIRMVYSVLLFVVVLIAPIIVLTLMLITITIITNP
jgi:hypothetical protein